MQPLKSVRFWLSSAAVFAVLFLSDMVIHGMVLMDMYDQTANLWRGQENMLMGYSVLHYVLLSVTLTYLFVQNYENKGLGEGLRFGLMIGAVIASLHVGMYAYLPIPMALMLGWVVGSLVQFLLVGGVLALVKPR